MAKYTNIPVALGEKTSSGSSVSFAYSTTDINNAINSNLPAECKITKAIVKFKGAKSYSFSGKGNITMSVGSYSKAHSGVIANDGLNDSFSSSDTECSSDDIKSYINSNGRFSSNLNFNLTGGAGTTYWRITATIYFDYETPNTISVSAGAGGSVSTTGGSYYSGNTFSVSATPNIGYKFTGWANTSGTITTTANPYSFTVSGNTTFSAVFTPITYYVSYNANGGSGTINTASVKFGDNYTLASNTFTAPELRLELDSNGGSGFAAALNQKREFNGWEDWGDIAANTGRVLTADNFDAPYYVQHPSHTDLLQAFGYNKYYLASHYVSDGEREGRPCLSTNGVRGTYAGGLTVNSLGSIDGAVVPLKAQWKDVRFYLEPKYTPTKEGYEFLYWELVGTNQYYSEDTYITISENATLKAHWKPTKKLNVYGGNTPAKVYVANKECKAVYVGNIKVYG